MSRIRLLPVLVFGLIALLSIKVLTLALEERPQSRRAQLPSIGDNFARTIERARTGTVEDPITTASVPAKDKAKPEGEAKKDGDLPKPAGPIEAGPGEKPKLKSEPEGIRLPPPSGTLAEQRANAGSPAEREILQKLRDRRTDIESQGRDIEMREQLLRQTERRLDDRIGQLRSLEAQNEAQGGKNDPKARYRPLVIMYENMKPKEAARVFDRLDIKVLIDLVGHMNPRKVSEILAVMDPSAAERLTVAMARMAAEGAMPQAQAVSAPGAETELPRLPVANPAQPRR